MRVRKVKQDLQHERIEGFESYRLISQNSWGKSEDEPLGLIWVPTSIVVAVHDANKKIGYMGQFAIHRDLTKRKAFKNIMRAIRESDHDPELEAWLSGAPPSDFTDEELQVYGLERIAEYSFNNILDVNRIDTARHLGMLGVSTMRHNWLESRQVMVGAALDPVSGDLVYAVDTIEAEPISEP